MVSDEKFYCVGKRTSLKPQVWCFSSNPALLLGSSSWGQSLDRPTLFCVDRRERISRDTVALLYSNLSISERTRWGGYLLEEDRERFLLGRGTLRLLLGLLRDEAPSAVAIEMGAHGKPHCPGGPEFNIGHSGDLVLIALHPFRPVGVDVEIERTVLDWEPIARRLFAGSQVEALLRHSPSKRESAFLRLWCRFEAELKAQGCGLAAEEANGLNSQACRWDLTLPKGYVGAAVLLREGACGRMASIQGFPCQPLL
ncbi:MAG: 4'-phosphopantetheinyl transferase superfamily protein [Prochlorococcaceae cyanobacterium]